MDPDTYQSQQLTQTVLPQGFRENPHFFRSRPPKRPTNFRLMLYYLTPICRRFIVMQFLLLKLPSPHCNSIKCPRQLGLKSLTPQSTNCFHHCQLHGIASHSYIQNNSSSETQSLDTDPQAPNQEGTSFFIRSIKLLPNMGHQFCPLCKTSLPSYSRKLR